MKGKITIVCDETGTHISVDVEELEEYDTIFLTHALGKSLGLSAEDYHVLGMAEVAGSLVPGAVSVPENTSEVKYES